MNKRIEGNRIENRTEADKRSQTVPVRILQVLGGTNLGGAESRVMDSYRHLDRERMQFDFCVHSTGKGFFDEEIESLGGKIYRLPRFKVYNWLSYRKAWKAFFAEHPGYAAVHGHMTSTASIYLPLAKKAGVPLTIAHARSAGVDQGIKGKITRFLRRNLGKQADLCLTCSGLAGEAVFGKKMWESGAVKTVPNAIDAAAFAFSGEIRERIRTERGIVPEEFVIGHVGRFGFMKNHLFLVEVFARIAQQMPARLMLVGEGGTMDEVRRKAEELGVADKVIFTGNQPRVADYLMAMDYFVFPSIFEGLPGSVVEAQAAGLRCLISDTVTDEVLITPLAEAMSLEDGAKAWAERILTRLAESSRKNPVSDDGSAETGEATGLQNVPYPRMVMTEMIKNAGFDIYDQVKMLEEIYLGNM